MTTGCKYYSAQGGYCRPTNTGTIDDKCFLEQNRCYTEPDYVKKFGKSPMPSPKRETVYTPPPSPSRVISEYKPEEALMISNELQYISGPISWYYFEFMGRRFHFFGDAHYSKSGTCEDRYNVKCSKINILTGEIDLASRCEDLIFLIKKIFDRSYADKTYTDFYMEVPYRLEGAADTQLDKIAEKIQSHQDLNTKELQRALNLDYISSIYVLFNSCFLRTKGKCSYSPYVRFHNADLRQAVAKEYQGLISLNSYLTLDSLRGILNGVGAYYQATSILGSDDPRLIEAKFELINQADLVQKLFQKLLLTGQTLAGAKKNYSRDLFNALLYSNDYANDVDKILDDLVSDIPLEKQGDFMDLRTVMTRLVAERNGHIVSRVKAQLDSLREDNIIYQGKNMADLIIDFINSEYEKTSLVPAYNVWNKFYRTVFEPFRKAVTISDIERGIEAYNQYRETTDVNRVVELVEADALVMDVYTLSRMFRRFTVQRHGRPVHIESNTVITYTGAAHTERYDRFFNDYLKVPRIDAVVNKFNIKDINRCLVDPRFSKYFK